VSEIGRGGCAVIYEATDMRLNRLVAVKVVRSDARDSRAHARLAREARAGAAIHHPNVCAITDAGYLEDQRPYLVMERLHGTTLTSYLLSRGWLGHDEALDIGLQLLSALDAAHSMSVVHRDVKPDNVFLVPRTGCSTLVKLLDFGMCRRAANQIVRDDMTLTRAGQVVGTPEYMAPEQVSGKRHFDARIDLYAVGVILYEALSGRRAFPGKDAREVVVSVLSRSLPPLRQVRPEVPVILDRIVSRAMEKDAGFRYSSALEFQQDLLEAKAALDAWARQTPAPRPEQSSPASVWDVPTRQISSTSRRAAGIR
jgi:serine/threonine-protein kinase